MVGRSTWILTVAAFFLAFTAPAQVSSQETTGESPLEVTEDGTLIYGGDVAYDCADVGPGIVRPGPNSSARTRAELERTNEEAIELCAEAGLPPPGNTVVSEDLAADEEGNLVSPPPPPLEVKSNGTLVVGGDVYLAGYCRAYVEDPAQTSPREEGYIEACEKAGYSPPGSKDAVLPETGGTPVAVLVLVATSILTGAGLAIARAS